MNNKLEMDQIADIKVIGVGGGGCNAVNRMIDSGLRGVEFIVANTDQQVLNVSHAEHKIQLGKTITKGRGAGTRPEVGREAALEAKEEIEDTLRGADMVFITCGLGGGTGTGAAPVVAEIAQNLGCLTVAIVTKPFKFEGKVRQLRAEKGIERLKNNVDDLIVVLNDNLLEATETKITFNNAFAMVDSVLEQGITGITDLLTSIGEVNIDFADIRTVMSYRGNAYMGIGRASGENKIEAAIEEAIENPLTESKIDGAKGVIFNFKGNHDLSLIEINNAASLINEKISEDANVIFGTVIDESMDDEVIVTVIATGVEEKETRKV